MLALFQHKKLPETFCCWQSKIDTFTMNFKSQDTCMCKSCVLYSEKQSHKQPQYRHIAMEPSIDTEKQKRPIPIARDALRKRRRQKGRHAPRDTHANVRATILNNNGQHGDVLYQHREQTKRTKLLCKHFLISTNKQEKRSSSSLLPWWGTSDLLQIPEHFLQLQDPSPPPSTPVPHGGISIRAKKSLSDTDIAGKSRLA